MIEIISQIIQHFLKGTQSILHLTLIRKIFTRRSTIGELYVDGEFECYTLEDEDKLGQGKAKIYGVTSIPFGEYEVDLTYSPKYKRKMPLLKDVPGFTGVRIHSGNTDKDTEGCILVGESKGKDWIGDSRKAYTKLFTKLEAAKIQNKKIFLRIES